MEESGEPGRLQMRTRPATTRERGDGSAMGLHELRTTGEEKYDAWVRNVAGAAQVRSVGPVGRARRCTERHTCAAQEDGLYDGDDRRREISPSQGRGAKSDGGGGRERRGGHAGRDRRGQP